MRSTHAGIWEKEKLTTADEIIKPGQIAVMVIGGLRHAVNQPIVAIQLLKALLLLEAAQLAPKIFRGTGIGLAAHAVEVAVAIAALEVLELDRSLPLDQEGGEQRGHQQGLESRFGVARRHRSCRASSDRAQLRRVEGRAGAWDAEGRMRLCGWCLNL